MKQYIIVIVMSFSDVRIIVGNLKFLESIVFFLFKEVESIVVVDIEFMYSVINVDEIEKIKLYSYIMV